MISSGLLDEESELISQLRDEVRYESNLTGMNDPGK